MLATTKSTITECHDACEVDAMDFPTILGRLHGVGVEGYFVDYRRSTKAYYLSDGDSLELPATRIDTPIAPTFDAGRVASAVMDAQAKRPGYTYHGFCEQVMDAGCAGYMVSISGRRVVYLGRTAETHTEFFPGSK